MSREYMWTRADARGDRTYKRADPNDCFLPVTTSSSSLVFTVRPAGPLVFRLDALLLSRRKDCVSLNRLEVGLSHPDFSTRRRLVVFFFLKHVHLARLTVADPVARSSQQRQQQY